MRTFMLSIGLVATAVMASTASAQTESYATALKTMLAKTAAGTCDADRMAGPLLAECRKQLPRMAPQLTALGPVTDMSFVLSEGHGDERMEIYKVTFAKGETHVWHIGALKDGKFAHVYSID